MRVWIWNGRLARLALPRDGRRGGYELWQDEPQILPTNQKTIRSRAPRYPGRGGEENHPGDLITDLIDGHRQQLAISVLD